jgi:hypothetical protein
VVKVASGSEKLISEVQYKLFEDSQTDFPVIRALQLSENIRDIAIEEPDPESIQELRYRFPSDQHLPTFTNPIIYLAVFPVDREPSIDILLIKFLYRYDTGLNLIKFLLKQLNNSSHTNPTKVNPKKTYLASSEVQTQLSSNPQRNILCIEF